MRWKIVAALSAGLVSVPAAPAAAGTVTTPNACHWSFDGYWRDQNLDFAGTGAPNPVAPGSGVALTGATARARLPDWVGEYGANFGILKEGDNEIPTKVWIALAGDGTGQAVQVVSLETVARTTVTRQPDGSYTATPIDVTVPLPDTLWTAGAAGAVAFRQAGPGTLPTVPGGRNGADVTPRGSVFISSTFSGGSGLQLDCQPGSAPSEGTSFTPALAGPFDSVPIVTGVPVTPAPALKPAVTVRSNVLRSAGRRVAVALACTGAACRGTVSVRTATKVRGRIVTVTRSAPYSLAPGARKTLKLTLSERARTLLRSRTLPVRVTVTAAGGETVVRRLRLR